MKPGQALVAAIFLSLWALLVIVGYFVVGLTFDLGWPYWAFAWLLVVLLLALPTNVYSFFVRAEYRNPKRGAMRPVRDADRD